MIRQDAESLQKTMSERTDRETAVRFSFPATRGSTLLTDARRDVNRNDLYRLLSYSIYACLPGAHFLGCRSNRSFVVIPTFAAVPMRIQHCSMLCQHSTFPERLLHKPHPSQLFPVSTTYDSTR